MQKQSKCDVCKKEKKVTEYGRRGGKGSFTVMICLDCVVNAIERYKNGK